MSQFRKIVLGGARSGKSEFAESLADFFRKPTTYIATAQALDTEMQDRVARHKSRRDAAWTTVEAPLDVASALRAAAADRVVLLDCATLWLSNQMLAGHDVDAACDALIAALDDCPAGVIVVSNEVGFGLVPETPLGRRFRDAQGRLNQRLAAGADLVVLVVAGLPLVVKGALPDGLT